MPAGWVVDGRAKIYPGRVPTGKTKERMVPKPVADITKVAEEVDLLIDRLARERKTFLASGVATP
jgi:hypothetical protein